MAIKDLGIATAYGYAKDKGYTGTEEEFAELMASYARVAQQAAASATAAAQSASNAQASAQSAAQSVNGFNTTVQTATNTAVNTVNTTKDSAVDAIEQKGTDTLASIPEDYTAQSKLFDENIANTTQEYTFADGAVSKIEHKSGSTVIRTDTFTYSDSSITEQRTLSTGESLTIITNLETLETTVRYA